MANPQVKVVLDNLRDRDMNRVFFVACGGSSALMYPSKYVMDREAKGITSDLYSSNEFVYRNPRTLDETSLVILCSHSGTTSETVEAAKFARTHGATTVSLTHDPESPLAKASEFVIKYDSGEGAVAMDTSHSVILELVLGLLNVKENNPKYESLLRSLEHLQDLLERARTQHEEKACGFAETHKDEKVIYTMASGANYGVAYAFAICILMEMQWIHSQAIHAGEYFHGPFEILDKDVPMILLLGFDETRPLEERALSFSKQYGERLTILDAKDLDLRGIEEDVKGYVAPLVLNAVLRTYAEALATARNHPLTTRRYMWKVAY